MMHSESDIPKNRIADSLFGALQRCIRTASGNLLQHAFALMLLLVTNIGLQTCAAEEAPALKTAQAFYTWVLANPNVSLPSDKQRAELANFFTPTLLQLMKDALLTEQRCIKAAPEGNKPDIFEGSLLVGHYEGATEVAYGELKQSGNTAHLTVDLASVDERFHKAHQHRTSIWRDTLEFSQKDTTWWISDIKLRQTDSLQTILKKYIEHGRQYCIIR